MRKQGKKTDGHALTAQALLTSSKLNKKLGVKKESTFSYEC